MNFSLNPIQLKGDTSDMNSMIIMNNNPPSKPPVILAIMRALEIGVTFVDTDLGLVEDVKVSYYMQATAQGIYLSVSILSTPKNKNYKVTITIISTESSRRV